MPSGFESDEAGGWIWHNDASPIIPQLAKAGLLPYLTPLEVHPSYVRATARLDLIAFLEQHREFASGCLHGLHADVGTHRRDFRSWRNVLGPGSLQVVVDEQTGNLYADCDLWNPYADVVNWGGHAFGEVIPHWVRNIFKRRV